MPRAVKEQSRSTYRQEQAAATRARIAQAARTLFAEHGYGSTSMDAIAREAGVAARTVYTVFGAKREILSAICEEWLARARAGELHTEALAEPDPARRLRLAAGWLRALYGAGFDVVVLFDAAADEDEETRALLRAKLDGRNHVMDALVASLEGALTVPLEEAQAVYRALAATGIYREFVVGSGWSPDRFEDWVADVLCRQLLGRSAPPADR